MRLLLRLHSIQKAPVGISAARSYSQNAPDSVVNFDTIEDRKFRPSVEMFKELKEKIYGSGKSVDKIVVKIPDRVTRKDVTLLMNRNVSNPHHCSMSFYSHLHERVAFARLWKADANGNVLKDIEPIETSMSTPIRWPCRIEYIELQNDESENVEKINELLWRSMTFFLAAVVKQGFKKPPKILRRHENVDNSYFAVDVGNFSGPPPTDEEIFRLNLFAKRDMISANLHFETLEIPDKVAEEYGIEKGNQLCRLENYVDLVSGPVIGRTSAFDKFIIPKAIPLGKDSVRFFGLGIPKMQPVNSHNWDQIRTNALKKITEATPT